MPKRDAPKSLGRTGYEITKQDVASSQLATAVWLWANEWDPISVHVLASSAAEIAAIFRGKKTEASVKSQSSYGLVNEFSEPLENYFKESFNFMKHGARDHSATLKFNPNESEWMIYHACVDYLFAFGIAPPEALFFLVYMTDQWPWLLRKGASDPLSELREGGRASAEGAIVARADVARSLTKLHQFAAHLRETGENDHPLLRQASPR